MIAGKWRVDSLLGSGSMAAVFAVTHRNGARAALKILHPTLCTDEGVCERFLGEGYLTNSVKHHGIVRVLDDGVTDDGCVFLVMDLLEGRTLEAFRQERGGQIELVEILDIADRLMDVLSAVHQAGIIHRDLKPQNVFICDDGSVKLLDFGVARVFDAGAQSKLSLFGLVLGTPSFMSPEQAVGSREKVDLRSDVWSLGATIFTSITGETVHLGPHVQAKLLAAATAKARSIALVKQDLPKPIALTIDTALRFKKEDRWQTVDSFRRALREARLTAGLGKPQSIAPPAWLDPANDLDGPTHADNGSRDPYVVVRTDDVGDAGSAGAAADAGEDAPQTLDDDALALLADEPALSEAPGRPLSAHGGTLIGVGVMKRGAAPAPPSPNGEDDAAADAVVKRVPSFVPPGGASRARAASIPAPEPKVVVREPVEIAAADRAHAKDRAHVEQVDDRGGEADGSYPAASNTLELDENDALLSQVVSRRSGAGVWIIALGLVLAVASGIAFFAVNGRDADVQGATGAQTPLTSATDTVPSTVVAPPPTSPAPSPVTTGSAATETARGAESPPSAPPSPNGPVEAGPSAVRADAPRTGPAAQQRGHAPPPLPPPRYYPPQPTYPSRAPVTQEPAPASPPPAPPTAAPDPFATPE